MEIKATLFTSFVQVTGEKRFQEMADMICRGEFGEKVGKIRGLVCEGRKKEADAIKKTLVAASFCARYEEGGRSEKYILAYNDVQVMDIDNIPPEKIPALRELLERDEHMLLLFLSPSGLGIKLVCWFDTPEMRRIRAGYFSGETIGYSRLVDYHKRYFALAKEYYERLAGVEIDSSGSDPGRLAFLSADPLCRINLPLLERITLPDVRIIPDEPEHREVPVLREPPVPVGSAAADPEKPAPLPGTVERFITAFLTLNPWAENSRNNTLFRLSCEAAKRGYKDSDLLPLLAARLSDTTFSSYEISTTVKSAYRCVARNPASGQGRNAFRSDSWDPRDSRAQVDTLTDEEEDAYASGEAYRKATPCFPDEIFGKLPDLFVEALSIAESPRERDMLLTAIFIVMGSALPGVKGMYDRKCYSPHLFSFLVAPPSTGKGITNFALLLVEKWFRQVTEESEQRHREWEQEMENYEVASNASHRKYKPVNISERPEEPAVCYLQLPTSISRSRLLIHLRDNKELGGLMFDSEADSLANATKQDYGMFDELIRKAFHHESVDSSYKVNGKPIYLRHPSLALFLAGTPDQFARLLSSSQNGLYSRICFYTCAEKSEWRDVSPHGDEDQWDKKFELLAERVYRYACFLRDSPTRIRLTGKQWMRLNSVFKQLLQETDLQEQDDFTGVVKRHGLITFRLCMVLTAIRKAASGWDSECVYCLDDDFEIALSVACCCLEHSRLLRTSLESANFRQRPLSDPRPYESFLKALPPAFTTAEALKLGAGLSLNARRVKRFLKRALGVVISQNRRGEYFLINKERSDSLQN